LRPHKARKHHFRFLRHSLLMIQRNFPVYCKLSVTVVISFSLLFAFLLMTDTQLFNKYKEIFSQSPHIVLCNIYGKPVAYRTFIQQIKKNVPDADYFGYITLDGACQYENGSVNVRGTFLPSGDLPVYTWNFIDFEENGGLFSVRPIQMLGEKQDFNLSGHEVIINQSWYEALIKGGAQQPIKIPVQFSWDDEKSSHWEVTVVGVCSDSEQDILKVDDDNSVGGWVKMYLSEELLSQPEVGQFYSSAEYSVWINSASPEKPIAFARALGFSAYGVSEAQQSAKAVIKIEKASEALVAALILILLSINLYSSFSNALHERCFEIGVKRALGAGKGHIVRQFLYESLGVLLFDSLLAASLIIDLFVAFKVYQTFVANEEWIIYMSPYSISIFLVCCLSLSIAFSLIFAFQSTQVEIISNLREE